MKPSLLIPFMVAASVAVAAESAQGPAPRPRLTDELRRQAEDMISSQTASAAAPAGSDGAVVLAPVRVTETQLPPLRSPEEASPKSPPFTWEKGGTFWKHEGRRFTTELQFFYDPVRNQTTFLSFS